MDSGQSRRGAVRIPQPEQPPVVVTDEQAEPLEELFMGRNATSVIGVAQARGAILVGLPTHQVRVRSHVGR
jgi:Holliday junction resolvasome RuvABC endonuclease subunit